jgi:hypothetical protein
MVAASIAAKYAESKIVKNLILLSSSIKISLAYYKLDEKGMPTNE